MEATLTSKRQEQKKIYLIKWIDTEGYTDYTSWEPAAKIPKDLLKIANTNPQQVIHIKYQWFENLPNINNTPIQIVNKHKHLGIWLSSFAPNVIDTQLNLNNTRQKLYKLHATILGYHKIIGKPSWNLLCDEVNTLYIPQTQYALEIIPYSQTELKFLDKLLFQLIAQIHKLKRVAHYSLVKLLGIIHLLIHKTRSTLRFWNHILQHNELLAPILEELITTTATNINKEYKQYTEILNLKQLQQQNIIPGTVLTWNH